MTPQILRILPLSAVFLFSVPAVAQSVATDVASAELYTSTSYGYGRFEASIQFAPGDGIVSSFFLWKNDSHLAEVYWNELDFEKLRGDCTLESNNIYGLPQGNNVEHHDEFAGTICETFHTYAYEWTPDYIAWFIDGEEVRRDGADVAEEYAANAPDGMQFRFNVWPGNAPWAGNFASTELPTYEYIDWVAYHAYTPGAGDDGSDFTEEWREEFDGGIPSGWLTGNWESPQNKSVHNANNVWTEDGVAVLALTDPTATGPNGGMTPEDPDPTTDPTTDPDPSGSGGTSGEVPSDPDASDSSGDGESSSGGCTISSVPRSTGPWAFFALLGGALALGMRRRRLHKG